MKKSLFLFATAALVLSGCNNNTSSSTTSETNSSSNSTSETVEITAEKWDAAFEEVVKNYTYKQTSDNKPVGVMEFTDNGYHMEAYSYDETTTVKSETYLEWTADKAYQYFYDKESEKWVKLEVTGDGAKKDFLLLNSKGQMTFIGRFSDFSYDEEKGGYFAESSKTTEVELNGEKAGNLEMSNVLVKFDNDKISEVTTSNTSLTLIGSTTFTFPTVSE